MPNVTPTPPKKTTVTTRQNSSAFSLLDIQKLIAESEERVIAHVNKKFDALSSKIDSLETSIANVKAVQVQQEADICHIKDILVKQQNQIEAYEDRERRCNLVISNLPETDVTFEKTTLRDDDSKVLALVKTIVPEIEELDSADILEVTRLGRGGNSPRIVKVRLANVSCRNTILRSCRNLNSDAIRSTFGRVFVNRDMSFLRRLEEKRLRLRLQELNAKFPGEAKLKNGKLFLGMAMKDCVDFRNQLF